MANHWKNLVDYYKSAAIEAPELRAITLAQWALESGRGQSRLAQDHKNFAGLKFRAEMAGICEPVDYGAHDGIDTYCAFSSIEDFVRGYWIFINRAVYDGWRDFSDNPSGYIRHLHSRQYATDPNYVGKVLSLLDEAEHLLAGEDVPTAPSTGLVRKLAVIVGHNDQAEGAFAASPLKTSEFDFNNIVAQNMQAYGSEYNFDVNVINRVRSSSTRREIEAAYKEADDWGAEVIVELHFNASSSASATGIETLVRNRDSDRAVANAVQSEMVATLQLYDRGVKQRGPSDRGGISLHASDAPTILVEPFFGSNPSDRMRIATIGEEGLAGCYMRGLKSGIGQITS